MYHPTSAPLGISSKRFKKASCSLGSGGASAAANAGIPDRLFQRHGRWKSVSAKDGYVDDKLSSRLSVSKVLVM